MAGMEMAQGAVEVQPATGGITLIPRRTTGGRQISHGTQMCTSVSSLKRRHALEGEMPSARRATRAGSSWRAVSSSSHLLSILLAKPTAPMPWLSVPGSTILPRTTEAVAHTASVSAQKVALDVKTSFGASKEKHMLSATHAIISAESRRKRLGGVTGHDDMSIAFV